LHYCLINFCDGINALILVLYITLNENALHVKVFSAVGFFDHNVGVIV
jgi:hypothetical protein